MADLGFNDGMLSFASPEISAVSLTGTVALTRVSGTAGLVAWNVAASSSVFFEINLMDTLIRRSGFFEDTQNALGSTLGGGLGGFSGGPSGSPGTGLPASAEPQGRPGSSALGDGFILPGSPQPVSAMGALQELSPRTALKIKGVKPLSLTVFYQVNVGAMTTLTCTLIQNIFKNNTAVAQTVLLASGANGLVNVAQTNPYVTNIPIPNAVFYQIAPNTQLWFEMNVAAPALNSFNLYGVELLCEFNYN
jgi:hypothetical protein